MESFYALVEVDGNMVTFYDYQIDNKTSEIIKGDPILTYDVYYDGLTMVVSNNDKEIRYLPENVFEEPNNNVFGVGGYAKNNDETYYDITHIHFRKNRTEDKVTQAYIGFTDGGQTEDANVEFNEDGTFTVSWEEVRRPKKDSSDNGLEVISEPYSFSGEYITNYPGGFVMNVDGQVYRYQYEESEYKDSIIDTEEDVSENDLPELVMTQTTLNYELINELTEAGIDAETDSKGRIVIGTNILFAVDSDEISEAGLTELERFFAVYARVVLPYIEDGSVAYVEVGGHTDTDGTYDYNLDLSQRRAEAVSDYALTVQPELGANMKAQGYSFSDPVLDDAGNVDKDASRRVVFKIVLNK